MKRVFVTGRIVARGTAQITAAMRPWEQILAEVSERAAERSCSTVTAAPGTLGLPKNLGVAFIADLDINAVYEHADPALENW